MDTRSFLPVYTLPDQESTLALGRQIANAVTGGDVIALTGTLGTGKTHLTKGIVAGLGCSDPATSPTFALVHEYHGGRLPVFHLDFYRLDGPEDLYNIGWEDILDENGLVIVEWADKFPAALPEHTVWIALNAPEDAPRSASIRRPDSVI